jgi:hypothetical protein
MPSYDRTGPKGLNAMTGRRMGQCVRNARNRVSFQGNDAQTNETIRNRMNWVGYDYCRWARRNGFGRRFQFRCENI